MSTKRVLQRRETLFIENWRANVLGWLNGRLPKRYCSAPARRRVEQLIASLQTLSRAVPHFKTVSEEPSNDPFRKTVVQMPTEACTAVELIQKLMRRYPSWPSLGWNKNNVEFGHVFSYLRRSEEEEAEAALAVMSLAEVSELSPLMRCLCGRWFFARRRNQRSCSPQCRHKLYEQTDKYKAKRRKYMKGYYRLKRSGKVR